LQRFLKKQIEAHAPYDERSEPRLSAILMHPVFEITIS